MQFVWTLTGWLTALGYFTAAGSVLATLWQPRWRSPVSPLPIATIAFTCHTLFLAGGILTDWLRLDTPETVAAALGWLITFGAIGLLKIQRMEAPAAFLLPLAAVLVAFGAISKPTVLPEHLRRDMLLVHVVLLMAGYLMLMLAFGAAVAHLLTLWSLKRKRSLALLQKLPPLEVTERLVSRWVLIGLPLLTLGMLVGVIWAKWEERAAWTDPKVLASVLTWIIFAAYLHARWVRRWEAMALHWLIIVGFACLLLTFFIMRHTLAME